MNAIGWGRNIFFYLILAKMTIISIFSHEFQDE